MAVRSPSPHRIKSNRPYLIEEAARTLGVHKNTIRRWISEEGLAAITDARPHIIPGDILKLFLKEKRERQRTKRGPGELFCLKCRASRKPAGDIAEYEPRSAKHGMLQAICSECECLMFRVTKRANLTEFEAFFEVQERGAESSITDPSCPSLNSDLL